MNQRPAVMGGIEDKREVEDVNNKEETPCDPVKLAEALLSKIRRNNVKKEKDSQNAKI